MKSMFLIIGAIALAPHIVAFFIGLGVLIATKTRIKENKNFMAIPLGLLVPVSVFIFLLKDYVSQDGIWFVNIMFYMPIYMVFIPAGIYLSLLIIHYIISLIVKKKFAVMEFLLDALSVSVIFSGILSLPIYFIMAWLVFDIFGIKAVY